MPSGGKREGSGRKNKYNENLIRVSITKLVPESKLSEYKKTIKESADKLLNYYKVIK